MNQSNSEPNILLKIARCPVVAHCLSTAGASHPCAKVVRSQTSDTLSEFQVPEPWSGHIESAPILFLSSNPSISVSEEYPRGDWPDEHIIDFFANRFNGGRKEWIVGGRCLNWDGSYGGKRPTYFWSSVKRRAEELLERDAVPGKDYVLSEVVHCKSVGEIGVREALRTCVDRYLEEVIDRSAARVVICMGDRAANAAYGHFGIADGQALAGPLVIGGLERHLAFLPHPSSFKPGKTLHARLSDEEFARLRACLLNG